MKLTKEVFRKLGTDVRFIPLGGVDPANEVDGLAYTYEQVEVIEKALEERDYLNKEVKDED